MEERTDGMSTHDLVVEVRDDVKAMSRVVNVLASQNLDDRLDEVESWKDKATGLTVLVGSIGGIIVIANYFL